MYLRLFGEKAAVPTIAVPLHLYFILLKIIVFLSEFICSCLFWEHFSSRSLLLLLLKIQFSHTRLFHWQHFSSSVWMSAPCKHLWHTCLNATGELTKHSWVFPVKVHHSSTRLHWPISNAPNCTHGKRIWNICPPFSFYLFTYFFGLFHIFPSHTLTH